MAKKTNGGSKGKIIKKAIKDKVVKPEKKYINPDIFENEEEKAMAKRYNKALDIMLKYQWFTVSDERRWSLANLPYKTNNLIKELFDTGLRHDSAMLQSRKDRWFKLKHIRGSIKNRIRGVSHQGYEHILDNQTTEVLELFARHYSVDEIHKKLIIDWGIELPMAVLLRFHRKNKLEIEKLKADYEKDLGQIGISKKRSRLEELDYIYRRNMQAYKRFEGTKMLPFQAEARAILEQARKEVEGNQIKLDISGQIDITATIESAKNVEELYSDINFMNLLISRVAARQRVNPLLLQHQLLNSWYSEFTGIKRNDSIMDEEAKAPSSLILNWDSLKEKARKKEIEYNRLKRKFGSKIEEAQIVDESKPSLKEALLAKVKKKEKDLQEVKAKVLGSGNK